LLSLASNDEEIEQVSAVPLSISDEFASNTWITDSAISSSLPAIAQRNIFVLDCLIGDPSARKFRSRATFELTNAKITDILRREWVASQTFYRWAGRRRTGRARRVIQSNTVLVVRDVNGHDVQVCKRRLSMNAIKTIAAAAVAVALSMSAAQAADKTDIVQTAISNGSFKTLVAAVKAAGLVETLKGSGPFTVFAPTDEAFAKLPGGTVENLLKPENKKQLVAILTYHVVPGKVMSKDIVGKKTMAKSVEGEEISIDATNGVKVDNAKVVKADVEASNGVIHVIDTVIMPKM
jgi:uncharacterized surface protein with fasciclin (FAS1) repeats